MFDRRSGLPVYEGTTDGGFAVVYGDAVKEPNVQKWSSRAADGKSLRRVAQRGATRDASGAGR